MTSKHNIQTELEISGLKRYGFTDPASARGKIRKIRARQAIVVVAADDLRRIFVLYSWAGRLGTSKYIDRILNVCENYETKLFGIEANSMQSLFADMVQLEAKKRSSRLPLVPVQQSTKVDKDFRIRSALEPVINAGRLFIQSRHSDLESELRGFPTASTKDLVDCLASAITLVPKRLPRQQENAEVEALAKYLRDTGAPASYIKQRISEVIGEQDGFV